MNIYRLSHKDKRNRVVYVSNESWMPDDTDSILRGSIKLFEPVEVLHLSGGKWYDFLTSVNLFLPVISEKVVRLFEINNLTGWYATKIKISNKPLEMNINYYLLSITGRSSTKLKDLKKNNNIVWDNSDFFMINGISGVYVTEKVFDILTDKKNKISNIELVNLVEDIDGFRHYL